MITIATDEIRQIVAPTLGKFKTLGVSPIAEGFVEDQNPKFVTEIEQIGRMRIELVPLLLTAG